MATNDIVGKWNAALSLSNIESGQKTTFLREHRCIANADHLDQQKQFQERLGMTSFFSATRESTRFTFFFLLSRDLLAEFSAKLVE